MDEESFLATDIRLPSAKLEDQIDLSHPRLGALSARGIPEKSFLRSLATPGGLNRSVRIGCPAL